MAGRARTRAQQREQALKALKERAAIDTAEHVEAMTPDGFEGHSPPQVPDSSLLMAALDAMPDEERRSAEKSLTDLWDKAVASAERILDSDDASATAKASVIRLIGEVRKRELEEERSRMPTRIVFETAAFSE